MPNMIRQPHASSDQRRLQDSPRLPKDFIVIRELLDGAVPVGQAASIIGVVNDFRAPIPTRGTDFKSTLTLYDTSTEENNECVDIILFRKESEMPKAEAGDVVVVSKAKVQSHDGSISLLTYWPTDIHVYDQKQLLKPRRSGSARAALRTPAKKVKREPDANTNEYVQWIFERVDKSLLPDPEQFSQHTRQSLNVRDKFSLLRDVKEGKFADLIVQVVKQPYYDRDMTVIWVSDYTENDGFFHKTSDSTDWTDGMPIRDGDPYGYTDGRKKPTVDDAAFDWHGPVGKMSMQITTWDPHASFIHDNVKMGHWLRLRNVQIAYGHSSINIEGKLRQDRGRPDKVDVHILDAEADRETIEPRLMEAIRRKRDYEKEHKQVYKTGEKRKADDPPPKKENAKTKRQRKRENERRAQEAKLANEEAALGFNEAVVAEHSDRTIVPLSTILKPVVYKTTIDNKEIHLELPFTCATYRTTVRVVDFHPASLQDFAVGRTITQYDILSDNEDSDSGSVSSTPSVHSTQSQDNRRWEWCFALKLEEVSASLRSKTPAQIWAVVDNLNAQLLLDLDATDLRSPLNAAAVSTLRERLFKLWGNLEERKIRLEMRRQQHVKDPLRAPPPDSSDGEEDGLPRVTARDETGAGEGPPGSQLSNRPFACCIKQYGIKARTEEGEVATAGEGKKWQRMFQLFGTKIKDD